MIAKDAHKGHTERTFDYSIEMQHEGTLPKAMTNACVFLYGQSCGNKCQHWTCIRKALGTLPLHSVPNAGIRRKKVAGQTHRTRELGYVGVVAAAE